MNHNNQQPGSADEQWIFDLAAKHESRGRELSGPITFSSTALVDFVRDAIAASRRASSLPDVAMPDHQVILAFEREMANDPEAYSRPGEVIYTITQKEMLSFVRKLAAQPAEGSALVAKLRAAYELFRNKGATEHYNALLEEIERVIATPAAVVRAAPAGWHDAVFAECMKIETAYKADDPAGTVRALINWYYEEASGVSDGVKRMADNYMRLTCATPAAEGATQAGEWISVDERLPEDNQRVAIVFWPYNNQENEQIVGAAEHVEGTFYTHEGDEHHPPSHWMPLPELPRIDGDKHGDMTVDQARAALQAMPLDEVTKLVQGDKQGAQGDA